MVVENSSQTQHTHKEKSWCARNNSFVENGVLKIVARCEVRLLTCFDSSDGMRTPQNAKFRSTG